MMRLCLFYGSFGVNILEFSNLSEVVTSLMDLVVWVILVMLGNHLNLALKEHKLLQILQYLIRATNAYHYLVVTYFKYFFKEDFSICKSIWENRSFMYSLSATLRRLCTNPR